MTTMRAKMAVTKIERIMGGAEVLHMTAVAKSGGYPPDGSDENNTFARFTPSGELRLTITNQQLLGKFEPGDAFYLDFSPAPR